MKEQNKKGWGFCETPDEKCTMNYCDENGCQNRKRFLIDPEPLNQNKMKEEQTQQIQDNNFLVWDKLFSKLAWKFQQTKSGDMFIDSEAVYNELKNEFELTFKSE